MTSHCQATVILESLHFPGNQNQIVTRNDVFMTKLLHSLLSWEAVVSLMENTLALRVLMSRVGSLV